LKPLRDIEPAHLDMNTKTDAALDDNGKEAYSDLNKDVLD